MLSDLKVASMSSAAIGVTTWSAILEAAMFDSGWFLNCKVEVQTNTAARLAGDRQNMSC